VPGVGFRISGIAFRGSGFIGWGVGLGFRERGERGKGGEGARKRRREGERQRKRGGGRETGLRV
jgi:hypothetical protein